MLQNKVRNRLKNGNFESHPNKSLFFERLVESSRWGLKDIALVASKMDEKHLDKVFTKENLEPFIKTIVNSKISQNERFLILDFLVEFSLENFQRNIQNKLLKDMYEEHKLKIMEITKSIYQEKMIELGKMQSIAPFFEAKKRKSDSKNNSNL